MFSAPQVNIYSDDVDRSVEFYEHLGFAESFRTPDEGPPTHVEMKLDGFTIGIASASSAALDHGLDIALEKPGRGMELVLWTDDADVAFVRLLAAGARVLSQPHDWLDNLRVAWVADPDDNPIELVQVRG